MREVIIKMDDKGFEVYRGLNGKAQELVRCKDCKHKPVFKDNHIYGPTTEKGYEDETCPCLCDDWYYNYIPEDDYFCANGERNGTD